MANDVSSRTTSLLTFAAMGAVGLFVCWREIDLSSRYSDVPQPMTCGELGDRGPGENVHVILEGFRPCTQGYVYYRDEFGRQWESVVIPLYPAGNGAEPAPEDIRVIGRLAYVAGEDELWKRLREASKSGIVVSTGDQLRGWDRRILADFYPGMDFDRCWVIDFDRAPPQKTLATYGMAFCVLIVGLGLGVVAWDYVAARGQEGAEPHSGTVAEATT